MISNIPSLATSVSWAPSSAIIERLQSIEKNILNMIKKNLLSTYRGIINILVANFCGFRGHPL